ncbi:MAG: hypothetical protein U0V56_06210 [Actinomycetota bacterium]
MVQFLAHRRALLLKGSLLFEPGVVVTDVPFVPELEEVRGGRALEPERSVVLVPVSGVHDATVRAVSYASSLHPAAIQAMFFVTDPEEVGPVIDARARAGHTARDHRGAVQDIDRPLLDEIRLNTERGDTVVTVVLPELVPRH